MKQTEKLASAAFLIKRAEEPSSGVAPEMLGGAIRDLINGVGGLAGSGIGAIGGGLAGLKYLPRLLKKLDLKNLMSKGKSKFSIRPYLRKGLYSDDIATSKFLDVSIPAGAIGGGILGYKLSDKLQGPSTENLKGSINQLNNSAANLKSEIPSMDRLKTMIKENPAIAGGAGVAGLAALLGGGYLAHKALSDKEEETPEEKEDKNKRIN